MKCYKVWRKDKNVRFLLFVCVLSGRGLWWLWFWTCWVWNTLFLSYGSYHLCLLFSNIFNHIKGHYWVGNVAQLSVCLACTQPCFLSQVLHTLCLVAQTYHPSTWEVDEGGSKFLIMVSYIVSLRPTWVNESLDCVCPSPQPVPPRCLTTVFFYGRCCDFSTGL